MKIFFGSLLIAIAFLVLWQMAAVRDSKELVDTAALDGREDVVEPMPRDAEDAESTSQELAGSSRKTVAKPDEAIPRNPFESTSNARNFILDAASTYGWTERVALQNALNWSRACEPARRLDSYRDIPFDELIGMGQFAARLVPFAEFCSGLPDASDLLSDNVRSELSQAATGLPDESLQRREIEKMIDEAPDLARETLVRQLYQALLNLDEATVSASILHLLKPETGAIQTTLSGQHELWYLEFAGVLDSVSLALLCQYHDGCIGQDHPMVLRTCMKAWESSGVGCLEPHEVFEAIYQTQTPVENMMHRHLLDQVNNMLHSYRRR